MVLLQRCYGILLSNIAFDEIIRHLRFILAPHHEHNFLCAHYRLHAHCYCTLGHFVRVREELILILARVIAQAYKACCRVRIASRLVEAHLTKFTDTHNHDIDTSVDKLFILTAIVVYILRCHCSIGEMNIGWVNIDIFQKILVHTVVTALWRVGCHRIELVEAVNDNIGKAHFTGLITVDEFGVQAKRSAARRKTKHKRPFALMRLYGIHYNIGSHICALFLCRADLCRHLLEFTYTLD